MNIGLDPVGPVQLLAFFPTAGAIADGDLVDPAPAQQELGGDLRLDPEPVLGKLLGLPDVPPGSS